MTRKIVAILLALVMTMSLMSVNVFAETYTVQISSDTYNAYDTTTGVTVSDGQLVATNANIFGIKLPTSISSGEKVYVKLSGSASGNFRVWLSDISQGTKSKEQPTIYPNSFTEAIELTASSTADVLLFKGTTFDSKDINMTLTGITLYTNGTQPPTEDFDTNSTILELTKTFKVGYNEIFRTDDNLVKKINAVGDECKFVFNCTSTASIPDFGWAQIMVRDTSDKDENIIIADLTKDLVNGKATVTWGAIKKAISDKGYSWTENKLKFIINTGKNDDGIGDAIDLYLVISKSGEGSATTDPNVCKHEKVTYTDNKDGTHSGVCDNCKKTVVNNEKHTFTGGKCSKCGVSEAEATIPSIPAAPAGYVAKEIVRVTEPIENAGWYVVSGADVSKIVAAMKEKDAIVHLYTTGTSATYGWFGIQLHDTNKKIDNNEYPTLKATTYSGDATKGEVALSTLTKDTSARIATIAVDNENVQKILKAIEENGGSLNAVAIGAGIECNMVGIVVYVPGTADPDCKHENITYTDNKDGTHDGICDSCKKTVVTKEEHTYEEGKCSKCGASETEAVIPEIPAAPEGYVEAEGAKFRVTSEVKANWNPVNDVNTSKLFEAMQKKGAILKVYSTSTTTTSGWVGIQTNSTDYPTYKATTYTGSETTDVATSTVKNENGINVFTVDNENVIKIVNAVKADGGALNGFVLSHDPADGNLIGVVVYIPDIPALPTDYKDVKGLTPEGFTTENNKIWTATATEEVTDADSMLVAFTGGAAGADGEVIVRYAGDPELPEEKSFYMSGSVTTTLTGVNKSYNFIFAYTTADRQNNVMNVVKAAGLKLDDIKDYYFRVTVPEARRITICNDSSVTGRHPVNSNTFTCKISDFKKFNSAGNSVYVVDYLDGLNTSHTVNFNWEISSEEFESNYPEQFAYGYMSVSPSSSGSKGFKLSEYLKYYIKDYGFELTNENVKDLTLRGWFAYPSDTLKDLRLSYTKIGDSKTTYDYDCCTVDASTFTAGFELPLNNIDITKDMNITFFNKKSGSYEAYVELVKTADLNKTSANPVASFVLPVSANVPAVIVETADGANDGDTPTEIPTEQIVPFTADDYFVIVPLDPTKTVESVTIKYSKKVTPPEEATTPVEVIRFHMLSGGRVDQPGGYILDLGPQFHGLFMSDGKMIPMAHIYNEFGVCTVCGRIQPASETESEGEVVVDTPVEDTDNKSEEEGDDLEVNDNDTPIEQPENNPKTGVVLGVLPLAAAAIAVLVSRKH